MDKDSVDTLIHHIREALTSMDPNNPEIPATKIEELSREIESLGEHLNLTQGLQGQDTFSQIHQIIMDNVDGKIPSNVFSFSENDIHNDLIEMLKMQGFELYNKFRNLEKYRMIFKTSESCSYILNERMDILETNDLAQKANIDPIELKDRLAAIGISLTFNPSVFPLTGSVSLVVRGENRPFYATLSPISVMDRLYLLNLRMTDAVRKLETEETEDDIKLKIIQIIEKNGGIEVYTASIEMYRTYMTGKGYSFSAMEINGIDRTLGFYANLVEYRNEINLSELLESSPQYYRRHLELLEHMVKTAEHYKLPFNHFRELYDAELFFYNERIKTRSRFL